MTIIIILIFLLCVSAVFSSLETGLLSLGEVKIRDLAEYKMKELELWIKEPSKVITGILVGNNFVNITFSAILTYVVVKIWLIPETFSEIVSIIASSALILIFGEIIPKTFANTYPEKIVARSFKPFIAFFKMTKAIIRMLHFISFSMVGVLRNKEEKK
ncbi:DUF21 domain-containing protein, partial [Elusimicrobiota bacterium]